MKAAETKRMHLALTTLVQCFRGERGNAEETVKQAENFLKEIKASARRDREFLEDGRFEDSPLGRLQFDCLKKLEADEASRRSAKQFQEEVLKEG